MKTHNNIAQEVTMPSNFGNATPVCIFCNSTKRTAPERKFVGDDRNFICSACVEEAQHVIRQSAAKKAKKVRAA